MKKIFFSLIFLLASNLLSGQIRAYKDSAIVLKAEGAIESFKYLEADSLKIPQGKYEWKQRIKNDHHNTWELNLIKTEFKNGKADGLFKWVSYDVETLIKSFNEEGIQSSPVGYQTIIIGQYEKGNIAGDWQFFRLPYGQSKDTLFHLNYSTEKSLWSYKDLNSSFSGTTNKGYFENNWDWLLYDSIKISSEYKKGILLDVSLNDKLIGDKEILNYVEYALEATDSDIKPAPDVSFIWTNGFDKQDTLYQTQELFSSFLQEKLGFFNNLSSVLDSNKYALQTPQIKGTKRFYYELAEKQVNHLRNNLTRLQDLDSTTIDQITYPIFKLKRITRPKLDELLNQTEKHLDSVAHLNALTELFLNSKSRYSSVKYLPELPNSNAATHNAYATDLRLILELNLLKLMDLNKQLEVMQFKLREESNIEELETEWTALYSEIENLYRPDKDSGLAFRLYETYVDAKFKTMLEEYDNIASLDDKKEFLKRSIEYTQWARNFFKNSEFRFLLDTKDEFNEAYINYLFNPYSGKYDIPEITRKRFLNKIQTEFWPWAIRNVEVVNEKNQLLNELELAEKYKTAILFISSDSRKESNKLVRRLRREKDMDVLAEKLILYLENLENNEED